MVYQGFEFTLKRSYGTKSTWRCKKEYSRCNVKVMTFGKTLMIKSSTHHNHLPTFKGDYSNMTPQRVFVEYSESFYKLPLGNFQ